MRSPADSGPARRNEEALSNFQAKRSAAVGLKRALVHAINTTLCWTHIAVLQWRPTIGDVQFTQATIARLVKYLVFIYGQRRVANIEW